MNWCARPRPKPTLDLGGCCGTARRDTTITIDVPEVAKQKLVISTDNMFTIGSVCIDRRGFHWKAPERQAEGANCPSDSGLPWGSGGLTDPADKWKRDSRNSRPKLEAKRGARESGKLWSRIPNLTELTTLNVQRNLARSVRLEDLVKIKGVSECLGKGVSGTVWKVRDKSVDETLALKEMAIDTTDEAKNQILVDEMRIMLELDHPSIVACHGVFYELGKFKIVMEFMDAGSLLDVMRLGDHTIPPKPLAGMMWQVLDAMSYLHKVQHVIHRDVKPGNILLNRQGQCKLADFGVCSKPRSKLESKCATWVGTVTYMSPERIKGDRYGMNADVWALGVIVVEATLGRYPYLADVADDVDKKKFEFWDLLYSLDDANAPCATKKLPPDTDKNLVSFAQYVLDKDSDTRANSDDALNHPFVAAANVHGETHMLQCISTWINKTLEGPRSTDARKISDALGGMNLGKPPLGPGGGLVGGDAAARQSARGEREMVNVRMTPRDSRPPSAQATPRKHTTPDDDAAPKKPTVVVPSSSRNSSIASSSAAEIAKGAQAKSVSDSVNGSSSSMNGHGDANGSKTSLTNGSYGSTRTSPRNSPRGIGRMSMHKGAPIISVGGEL